MKSRRKPIRQKPPIQPRRPDQWANSDVSIEQQQLIGLLVLNWSKLETDIDGAIWAFLDLDIDKGRVITTKLNTDVKVELLRALINTYCAGEVLDELLRVMDFIGGYKEDRNFVVHGSWGTLTPENVPVCGSIRQKAPPGEVIVETFPKERMLAIINGILEAKQNLRTLMSMIEGSRQRKATSHRRFLSFARPQSVVIPTHPHPSLSASIGRR
jgi:hypothetical protein